ncbi:hypothetical protein VNO78_19684 [Psophocarpus tetragonolobus]|uniref:Uncharacterized protein n=1 Tax=Psophocarpus tetragonolobus TaxID=3891 RepID=A0AAN9XGG2_PSOTE
MHAGHNMNNNNTSMCGLSTDRHVLIPKPRYSRCTSSGNVLHNSLHEGHVNCNGINAHMHNNEIEKPLYVANNDEARELMIKETVQLRNLMQEGLNMPHNSSSQYVGLIQNYEAHQQARVGGELNSSGANLHLIETSQEASSPQLQSIIIGDGGDGDEELEANIIFEHLMLEIIVD